MSNPPSPLPSRANTEARHTARPCKTSVRQWLDRRLLARVRELETAGDNWIDVGCGAGDYRHLLAEANVLGTYTGVDLSIEQPSTTTEDGHCVTMLHGDAIDLAGVEGAPFDRALSVMVFEHVEDDLAAARSVHSVLTNDGTFVLAVPAPAGATLWGPRHGYRWYDRAAIETLAEQSGFRIEQLEAGGGWASWLVNSFWFMGPYVISKVVRAAAYVVFLGDRERAWRRCPWLGEVLPALQFWHCRFEAGRALHGRVNAALLMLDRLGPKPTLAWIAVLQRDAAD